MSVTTENNAVLKSFEPRKNQDGTQRTWDKDQKTYYEYTVVITKSDGSEETGTMSSTTTSPKWKIGGKMLKYTKSVLTNDHGTFISYKGIDWEKTSGYSGGGGGGKSGYKQLTREDKDRIIRSVALEVAHNALIDLNKTDAVEHFKTLTATANVFVKFVQQYAGGVKEKEMMLENAIRRAVDGLQFRKYVCGKVKDDKGNLTIEDKRGMDSAAELTAYAWECFSYIWAGPKEDGYLMTPEEMQAWEQSKT